MPTETLQTRYGTLQVPGGNDLISRFLREFGEWAWLEASFVGGFVDKGSRVLDGGAYIGSFTLGLHDRHPERVVAVEANPEVLGLLRHNLGALASPWAVVEHGLLGDGRSPVSLPQMTHTDNLGSMSFVRAAGTSDKAAADPAAAMIDALSIASLRQRHGAFDLIKLDIEGGELAALQADAEWLRAERPSLWLECNEDPAVLSLHDYVASLGYEQHYFAFPSFNPENHCRNPHPIFAVAYEAGLLAVKPGTPVKLPDLHARTGCDLVRLKDRAHLRQCLWLTPRWGQPEWASMPRHRLLAMCSRLHRGQSFSDFLNSP
jgi:FkbM family methyltransferase